MEVSCSLGVQLSVTAYNELNAVTGQVFSGRSRMICFPCRRKHQFAVQDRRARSIFEGDKNPGWFGLGVESVKVCNESN